MSNKEITIGSLKNFIDIEGFQENEVIVRKQNASGMLIDPIEEMTYVATISDTSTDMDSDCVFSKGCDISRIMKQGTVLWSHAHSSPPVGKILALSIEENCIKAKIKMAPTALGNELWTLIKGGYLKTNSIGFVIKKAVLKGQKEFAEFCQKTGLVVDAACNRIITEFVLVEDSLCSIPSNENALVEAVSTKSIHLDEKLTKELGIKVVDAPAIIAPIVEPVKTIIAAPVVEPVIVPEKPIVEPVKTIVEPIAEIIVPPIFTLIRDGDYQPTSEDVKQYRSGKIVTV